MDSKWVKIFGKNSGDVDKHKIPIRRLHVAPIKADMDYQIKCYFQRFGVVTSVMIIQQDGDAGTHFALVEFESTETASIILASNEIICIDGNVVEVKAAEPWQQLNDFTNTKTLDLTEVSYKKSKILVQIYGSIARSVIVTRQSTEFLANDYEMDILAKIAQCCTTELKELTLHNFRFEKKLPNDINFGAALCKLEKLSFIDCQIRGDLMGLLSSCVDLRILWLERCTLHHSLSIWPKFKKLDELRLINFTNVNGHHPIDGDEGLIALNSTITKLSVLEADSCCGLNILNTVKYIDRFVPNLVELELGWLLHKDGKVDVIVHHLVHLKSLKVLKLGPSSKLTTQLIALLTKNHIRIEHMTLTKGKIDAKTIENILQMKRLKSLEFRHVDGMTDEHMIELANGLGSRLEKLKLNGSTAYNLTKIGFKRMLEQTIKLSFFALTSWKITIDTDDFQELLQMVQKRPEKVKLLIELSGSGDQIKVSEEIRMKNCDDFQMDDKIDEDSDYEYSDSDEDSSDGEDDDDHNDSMQF